MERNKKKKGGVRKKKEIGEYDDGDEVGAEEK